MKQLFTAFLKGVCILALLFSVENLSAQAKLYGTATDNESFGGYGTFELDGYYYNTTLSADGYGITKLKANGALDWIWTRSFPAPAGRELILSDIRESQTGNLLVTGVSQPIGNSNDRNLVILEIHRNSGEVLKGNEIDVAGTQRLLAPQSVLVSDCGTATCGGAYVFKSWISGSGGDDILVMKLDLDLNPVWSYQFDGSNSDDEANTIMAADESINPGGVVIAGASNQTGWKAFVVELDCNGSLIPARSKGYTLPNGYALGMSISRGMDGDILLAGRAEIPAGSGNAQGFVARLKGTTQFPVWSRTYNDPGKLTVFRSIAQRKVANGNVYSVYTPNNVSTGEEPRVVMFRYSNGQNNKVRDLGDGYCGYMTTTHNKLLLHGQKTVSGGIGITDAWFGRLNLGMTTCGMPVVDSTSDAGLTRIHGYSFNSTDVLASLTASPYCDGFNTTLTNIDACGVSARPSTGTKSTQTSQFVDLELLGSYYEEQHAQRQLHQKASARTATTAGTILELFPNPTSQTLQVTFDASDAQVQQLLKVVSTDGRVLRTAQIQEGQTSYQFDITALPSGIYFVQSANGDVRRFVKQ